MTVEISDARLPVDLEALRCEMDDPPLVRLALSVLDSRLTPARCQTAAWLSSSYDPRGTAPWVSDRPRGPGSGRIEGVPTTGRR